MPKQPDVIVVGGGLVGTATTYALAKRGLRVALIERFEVGHMRGSSGGPTRIFRFAYPQERYARMAEPALAAWRSLEKDSGESLLVRTGGIDIGGDARDAAKTLESVGRTFEWLDSAQARERWPGIRFTPSEDILFQPDAGVCFADRTVRTQAGLAAELGAELSEGDPVASIDVTDDGATVLTGTGEEIRAPVAVVTAGAWAAPLLRGVGIDIDLTPTLEQVSYFRLAKPSPLPTLIDWSATAPASEGFMRRGPYAVPNPERPGDVKIALHLAGPAVDPDGGPFDVDPQRIDEVLRWAQTRFEPLVETDPAHTCLYTRTPDHDFVVDRVGPIVVGSPCSGHGFKFGPLMGQVLADLATGTDPEVDISAFSVERPDLRSAGAA